MSRGKAGVGTIRACHAEGMVPQHLGPCEPREVYHDGNCHDGNCHDGNDDPASRTGCPRAARGWGHARRAWRVVAVDSRIQGPVRLVMSVSTLHPDHPRRGCPVCVVDDEPGVRELLCTLCESAGLAAEAYDSAESFLSAYRWCWTFLYRE